MARSRNIKPSIMVNEELAELPVSDRLLFIYLWMLADREGRLEDRPKRIKAQAFPYDDIDVNETLDRLSCAGFIRRYEVEGTQCIQILNFDKHQTPHVREAASTLPSPEKAVPRQCLGSVEASPRSPDSLIPDSLIGDIQSGKPDEKKKSRFDALAWLTGKGVDKAAATDWLKVRRAKRAANTETAFSAIEREACKAGLSLNDAVHVAAERSWQGFKADWVGDNKTSDPFKGAL